MNRIAAVLRMAFVTLAMPHLPPICWMPCDHNAGNPWEAAPLRRDSFAHALSHEHELIVWTPLDGHIVPKINSGVLLIRQFVVQNS